MVEGKYDAIRLDSVLDALIVTTGGFGVIDAPERVEMLRALARERGLIVATDSDRAGMKIRGYLRGVLTAEETAGQVAHVFMPPAPGLERRKRRHGERSRDGLLGIEGADTAALREMFEPFADAAPESEAVAAITKADLYECGLYGGPGSEILRARLCGELGLPPMRANMLLQALRGKWTLQQLREWVEPSLSAVVLPTAELHGPDISPEGEIRGNEL